MSGLVRLLAITLLLGTALLGGGAVLHPMLTGDAAAQLRTIADTPYWRTLKSGGELNPKYPGGVDALKVRLEAEGHRVFAKGKKWIVADYERGLVSADGKGSSSRSGPAKLPKRPAKTAGR